MAHESPESGCLPGGPRIAIIGAGVVGLSCAHQILKDLGDNVQITVIAEGFMNQTTTFGSGGLWEPYQIAGTRLLFSIFILLSTFDRRHSFSYSLHYVFSLSPCCIYDVIY